MILYIVVTASLYFALLASAAVTAGARVGCGKGRFAQHAQCCVWYDVLDDIQAHMFDGDNCGEVPHESLRLSFHDAIGFSPQLFHQGKFGGGGADGSIMAFSGIETHFDANAGIDEIVEIQRPFAIAHPVSFGDFIQFAAAVGVTKCGGGPHLEFLAGRSNHSQPSPDGLIPEPIDSADKIIARMGDAGFTPNEIVDLLISHTIADQEKVDPSIAGSPFDTTPEEFDGQLFLELLLKGILIPGDFLHPGELLSPIEGELRLQSDFAFARDPRTACEWQSFITDHDRMVKKFEDVMAKLAILGHDRASLVDCSEVIPLSKKRLNKPFTTYPAGKSRADVQVACKSLPFPTLSVDKGPPTIAPNNPPN